MSNLEADKSAIQSNTELKLWSPAFIESSGESAILHKEMSEGGKVIDCNWLERQVSIIFSLNEWKNDARKKIYVCRKNLNTSQFGRTDIQFSFHVNPLVF